MIIFHHYDHDHVTIVVVCTKQTCSYIWRTGVVGQAVSVVPQYLIIRVAKVQ